jgi:Fe-S oxidoreductase
LAVVFVCGACSAPCPGHQDDKGFITKPRPEWGMELEKFRTEFEKVQKDTEDYMAGHDNMVGVKNRKLPKAPQDPRFDAAPKARNKLYVNTYQGECREWKGMAK